ncbi:hypothetical protein Cantr_06586 [Candida viswanathii]|uniref:Uncharacterized protein n=1 Tax=Candida viswanathii TaxID=5486 RepID=A0A367XVZ2_9ASCO|nr:hypothetical protein Cantr_06586 [Candida viswanathii]
MEDAVTTIEREPSPSVAPLHALRAQVLYAVDDEQAKFPTLICAKPRRVQNSGVVTQEPVTVAADLKDSSVLDVKVPRSPGAYSSSFKNNDDDDIFEGIASTTRNAA